MASLAHAALCAVLATAFWTVLGYALTRQLLPRALALGAAPVVGWAVFSATTLPILTLAGFTLPAVVGIAVLCLVSAGIALLQSAPTDTDPAPIAPAWSYGAAAALAFVPASAIAPKISGEAVRLANPIFDHAKIALVDAITRQGLPPVDPAFGAPGRLAYYYLWHFSAAELALPLRVSGWEADIGLTWFTAFASLALLMGIAVWLARRPAAAILVVALAAAASLRMTLRAAFGSYTLEPFLATPTGFAGWLFQSAWVPQHLMAASCTVAAMLFVVHYAERPTPARLVTLILLVVAGYESSAYVGGITFAAAALVAAPIVLAGVAPARRLRIATGLAAAALLAVVIAAPFIRDQFAAVGGRGDHSPIVIHPFEVLGDLLPQALRHWLDLPAYWLILLPVEWPAAFIAGGLALFALRRQVAAGAERAGLAVLSALAGAGLAVSWLLASTVGDNNDLALRAVLPATMVLIAGAAAGMLRAPRRGLIAAVALGGLLLSLPDTAVLTYRQVTGTAVPDGQIFAQTPELWAAVRRHAPPTARVANNPLFLQDLTPWPGNMSWALLANRSSCFAGREMALAFAPLPAAQREAIDTQFIRVFAGAGSPGDVGDMANKYGCDVVVVVPQDGAWANDPFTGSPDYRLAEAWDGRWRIYVRNAAAAAPSPGGRLYRNLKNPPGVSAPASAGH